MIGYSSAKKSFGEKNIILHNSILYDFMFGRFLSQNQKLKIYAINAITAACEWIYLYALFILYLFNNIILRYADYCRTSKLTCAYVKL